MKRTLVIAVLTITSAWLRVDPLFAQGFGKFSEWSEPVNLGQPVNSEFDDLHTAISTDGLRLYFVSNRPEGFGGEDIWISQRASLKDPWGEPRNLGSTINTEYNEFAPNLSPDGHWMYFASGRPGGCGGADLWGSWREDPADDFGWEPPVNLGCIVNSAEHEAGPFYYEDNEQGTITLYFASSRLGGFDIYASTLGEDGSWNPAVLVEELSTPQSDSGPDIRPDGLELFFHSNRPGSLGGRLDLWVSTRQTTLDAWSTPVNLGPKLNTEHIEHGSSLTFDATTLYFDSDRPDGVGGRDIYVTTRKKMGRQER